LLEFICLINEFISRFMGITNELILNINIVDFLKIDYQELNLKPRSIFSV